MVHRRAVVNERTALTNRLKALLKQYFPQALDLAGEDLWRPMAIHFFLKWPTLQALQKARPQSIRQFYRLNGSRSQNLLEKRLQLIAQAVPLTEEPALLESYTLRVELICRQLNLILRAIQHYDQEIGRLFKQHPDYCIFSSFPAAGPTLGPRLLASMGSDRDRFPEAASLQRHSGVAPVTKQSGGKCYIHRRYLCPKFLRQSFHEYAAQSIFSSRWAAAYYKQQRDKGASHHTAVRALAYKWQRIICKCWLLRKPYQEQIYEAALQRSQSPLAARLDAIELGKNPAKKAAKKP